MSALMAFEQGGILSCHICYDMVPYTVSPEGLSHLIASHNKPGLLRAYSIPNPHDTITSNYFNIVSYKQKMDNLRKHRFVVKNELTSISKQG